MRVDERIDRREGPTAAGGVHSWCSDGPIHVERRTVWSQGSLAWAGKANRAVLNAWMCSSRAALGHDR